MSVVAALQDMFTTPELTHPVQLGGVGVTVRGFLNTSAELETLAGLEIQHVGPVLFLRKGELPGLQQDASILVGAIGAASAAGGRTYVVHRLDPIEDGLILACALGGGR